MKKFFKILIGSVLIIVVLLASFLALFIYKVKNGFPVSYETDIPTITFPEGKRAVLLFSKSTGFRHEESIEASKKTFDSIARKNDWFLYSTEEGGIFNAAQLARFDVVIFNNSTGRVLNDEQQQALEQYVEQGGELIGIHGAGDDSHHWNWYVRNLTGAPFSHHPLDPQFQETTVTRQPVSDSSLVQGLPERWTHTDEWYVFFENPQQHGFTIIYNIDGNTINPNGNMLWVKDKNFGMGSEHPVAWYKRVGKGRAVYTSMGHDKRAWQQTPFVQLLENAVNSWKRSPQ